MTRVHIATDLDSLPDGTAALLDAGADESLFLSAPWFRLVCAHGMPSGSRPFFATALEHDRAVALLPLAQDRDGSARALETPYTVRYAPVLAPSISPGSLAALLRGLRRFSSVRLDALDPDAPGTGVLHQAARAAGQGVLPFDHFGNWHEDVGGLGWDGYLARRPGQLRSTVRRKLARMTRDGGTLRVVSSSDTLESAIAAYEAVYARSWKEAEPYPDFNPALMRVLAPLGKLRLAIYRLNDEPVAAQFWLVEHGRASVLKLAHDDSRREASPGTVLTALMLRRLLDEEGVREIDFGRGDDDYKRLWASQRRQMVGLLLVNPLHPRGLALLARHRLGGVLRRFRRGG